MEVFTGNFIAFNLFVLTLNSDKTGFCLGNKNFYCEKLTKCLKRYVSLHLLTSIQIPISPLLFLYLSLCFSFVLSSFILNCESLQLPSNHFGTNILFSPNKLQRSVSMLMLQYCIIIFYVLFLSLRNSATVYHFLVYALFSIIARSVYNCV